MSCDCLDIVGESLKPDHRLDTAILMIGDQLVERPPIRLMRLDRAFTAETRRGKPGSITPTFCPFCGVKYDDGAT